MSKTILTLDSIKSNLASIEGRLKDKILYLNSCKTDVELCKNMREHVERQILMTLVDEKLTKDQVEDFLSMLDKDATECKKFVQEIEDKISSSIYDYAG